MNVACIMWNSRVPIFARAGASVPEIGLRLVSLNDMEDAARREEFFRWAAKEADVLLAYHTQGAAWMEMEGLVKQFAQSKPVVSIGRGPDDWALSNQPMALVAKVQEYVTLDGENNAANLLRLLARDIGQVTVKVSAPLALAWDGIYAPGEDRVFRDAKEFLPWATRNWKHDPAQATIGLLFHRTAWAARNTAHVDALVHEIQSQGGNVIAAFCAGGASDTQSGARRNDQVIEDCFFLDGKPVIHAALNMRGFFLGDKDKPGVGTLKGLGVPVLSGLVAYRRSEQEWLDDPQGVSRNISMSVSGPEFDGIAEPLVIAAIEKHPESGVECDRYAPIAERVKHAAARLIRWARLGRKPVGERKVAFILHNSPCASVEATVGGGAKLDTLESVARILARMREAGYAVEAPESGKALIDEIMGRKAISEFRWTSASEIVAKGGCLDQLGVERYRRWFDRFPLPVQQRLCEAWGNPPGEEKDGIPAAMLHEGRILVTGIKLGNAVVCIQPKRGCAGSRCDGQVCKILHDPTVPPTHQYIATYRWIEEEFGADCIVHVGTHGNLEFLPGKSVGLSDRCYPDLCLGTLPHLYIYNADNPPEGVIAKRRSMAVLVDHMQTVMTEAGTYQELEEIEALLAEHHKASVHDKARAHQIEHRVFDLARKARLLEEMGYADASHADAPPFAEFAERLHEQVFLLKNSGLAKGMHILGELPQGEDRVELLYAILKHASGNGASLRERLALHMGFDLGATLNGAGEAAERCAALERLDRMGKRIVALALDGLAAESDEEKAALEAVGDLVPRIRDINARVEASREIEALLSGFDARYIPSGPSGLITRGRDDVLPTGRNFYSLDPRSVPTRSAFQIGRKLADALVARYAKDHGEAPRHVALYWMANDIMWSDGEVMAQVLDLIGCEPVWDASGRVNGFRVVPTDQLRRPRIDVTVRVSGITRDNFPNCIELVDEAIQAVAALNEPPEVNALRAHVLESLHARGAAESDAEAMREATYRVFAAQPGSYQAGVQLAVYASAWKEEKDLSDIFIYWNGYAYGKGRYGIAAHESLRDNLKTVELTYNKTATDESDLFGCCCYFGTHGGMTAAARTVSGRETPAYYGDTREPMAVSVRTLQEEVQRVVRAKLLNPKWIESMKPHGYKGAGDIAKRIGRIYGWEASAHAVADWIFDEITDTFVLDPEMKQWFEENNKWAFEEIARRLIEAHERGLWETSEERWEKLGEQYLEIESWMEEDMGDHAGSVQGGSIDILTAGDVRGWSERMRAVLGDVKQVAKERDKS
jgi:cobaltochelatase CobN